MIDLIVLYIPGHFPYPPTRSFIPYGYNNWSDTISGIDLEQHTNNLKVCVSLPKLINGHNIMYLSKDGVKSAIDFIEKELYPVIGDSMNTAWIHYLECGATVKVNETPDQYLQLCSNHLLYTENGFKKPTYETKIFINGRGNRWTIAFELYDKLVQMRSEKELIPLEFQGFHFLKLEYKLKSKFRIEKVLGKGVRLRDLYNSRSWNILKDQFYTFYKSIPKTGKKVYMTDDSFLTTKGLKDLITFTVFQEQTERWESLIREKKAKELISNDSVFRFREWLKEYGVAGKMVETNDLIQELDRKIDDWYASA